MRSFLTISLFLGSAIALRADTFVYVSMAPEQKIQIYRLDSTTGKLTAVEAIAVEGAPGALAVDPKKKFLFASLRTTSTLVSFRIDPATGKLKLLSTVALPKGENAVHVGTDQTGRWLLSASYAAGKVVVHRIQDDGKIKTPAVQTIVTAKTAHCAVTDRDNRFVFVPHVTPNAVHQFGLNEETGKLTEAGKAAGGTAKAGPRHLAFHPKLDIAFTSDEQGSTITAYRFRSPGGLEPVQTLSTLPAEFKGKNTTAEVKVHPNGKFVWVSNRGHDSLAGFAIDGDSGKLTALGQTPTQKTPRSFDISPDGRFILAAGEGSGKLAVYQVNDKTGKLTLGNIYNVGKSLTWVLGIEFGELPLLPPNLRDLSEALGALKSIDSEKAAGEPERRARQIAELAQTSLRPLTMEEIAKKVREKEQRGKWPWPFDWIRWTVVEAPWYVKLGVGFVFILLIIAGVMESLPGTKQRPKLARGPSALTKPVWERLCEVTASGAVVKVVRCESCQVEYGYELDPNQAKLPQPTA
jgi:6-phosphogluconolactonase